MTALDESPVKDDTAVFLFSDHGDYGGDYGLVEKWPSGLEDVLTRVPFIVRTPGGASGHVVEEPVEMMDMMATVLELTGVKSQHTHFARSLVPQLGGARGDPTRAVFAEGGYSTAEPHCFEGRSAASPTVEDMKYNPYAPKLQQQIERPESVSRSAMIRTADHKLIHRRDGISELYDLRADPRELDNGFDTPALAQVQSELQKRLLDWYLETADVTPLKEDARDSSGWPPLPLA